MIRTLVFAGFIASMAAAATAHAGPVDDFGSRGQLIISADRLSPLFSYARVKQDQGNNESTTTSSTSMSLLWTGSPQDYYDIPRAGLDYVIAPNLTLGGDVFATIPFSSTRSQTQNGTTTSRDTTKINAFGLGLRVGYAMPLTPRVSFWPRGGLSFTRVGTTNQQQGQNNQVNTSVSQWALNLEPIFVIQAAPHFGFMLGPVIDLPLSGTQHSEFTDNNMTVSQDNNISQTHIGVTAGLLGWI